MNRTLLNEISTATVRYRRYKARGGVMLTDECIATSVAEAVQRRMNWSDIKLNSGFDLEPGDLTKIADTINDYLGRYLADPDPA